MNKPKIFIAAPISGFQCEKAYHLYRESVISLISELNPNFDVVCELSTINNSSQYNSPDDSAAKDFSQIRDADIFIFLHPKRMQSSSLIELGFAIALRKKILIVGKEDDLPYLALGIRSVNPTTHIISTSEITPLVIEKIKSNLELNNPLL